jgi:DNA-binding transcriptional LysR family regulator
LRLTVPRAVVPILLEPLIASFCQAYPEVQVEIAANEELVNLAAEGFDAGIRLGQFIAADMVALRLTRPFPFVVVSSPEYLRRRKRPVRIDDLRQHACLSIRLGRRLLSQRNACHAVSADKGIAAARRWSTLRGLGASSATLAIANSAAAPERGDVCDREVIASCEWAVR